ncbi:MAG: PAS domain S-box protein [Desulfosarcina sp.]
MMRIILKDNEQLLNVFARDLPVALAMFDRDMRYVFASDCWRHDYDLGDRPLEGVSHYELFPEIPEEWREAHLRGLAGEVLRAEADRFERLDGSVQWVRWELRPWHNETGDIGGIIIFTEDLTDIILTEKKLQKQENLYRELVENSNSAMIRWKADGTLTFFNEYAQRLFGYTAEDIIGRSVNILVPEKGSTGDDLSDLAHDIVEHPERYQHNINENITHDGRRIWMSWTNRPLFSDGEVTEILAVGSDVTEQKLAEEALRENQQRLRMALEAAYVISFEWDIQNNEVRRLMSYESALEPTEDDKLGTFDDVLEVVHPDDRELFKKNVEAALEREDGEYKSEYRLMRSDGEVVWLYERGCVDRDAAGHPVRLVGLSQDITERKKADAAQRESDERLRAIIDSTPDPVFLKDLDYQFILVNRATCKAMGKPADKIIGKTAAEIFDDPATARAIMEIDRRIIESGESETVEEEMESSCGLRTFLCTKTPYRDGSGRIIGLLGVAHDITDRKKAEAALRELKVAAEKANQAKSEFLANMSHEIRTPMTVFMAAVEHLLQLDRNPERRLLLGMADQSARRLRSLIDDILDFSRIEAGEVEIEEVHFDLRDCIREAVDMFVLPAREKDLQLEMEIDAEVPRMVVGDPDRLGQILINLVGNAIKFTHEGEVRVSVRPHGDVLEFSVADTGIGIPEDKLDLLFQSFSQGDASFTRQYGGTGLGLAISKGLVELMGGEISVQSRKREGSVFTFSLPLKPVEQSHPAPAEAPPEAPAKPQLAARILLAEDDPTIRKMITMMLCRKGWQIDVADTGREALDQWASGNFDLILMDLQMPQMSGLEVTRNIREKEAGREKRTCIIGLTAHALRETRDEYLKAGMDRVLIKPFQIEDLYSVIDGCLSG